MDLTVRHQTLYHYKRPPNRVSLLLRLFPSRFDGQHVKSWTVTANGKPVSSSAINSFGDVEAFVQIFNPDSELLIEAFGEVETRDCNGLVAALKSDVPADVYLRSTGLTAADAAILALAEGISGDDWLSRLHKLSAKIRDVVAYVPGHTTSETTAAEALAFGKGVCQDHAHIFVAAARSLGVPARYVAGYYLSDSGTLAVNETHGWAEAMIDGLGWVGFDITNGVSTTDHYVRLCSGLDAHEAAPVRGAVFGAEQIGIDADVMISEAKAISQQQ